MLSAAASDNHTIIDHLLQRRVILLLGKGGVGRTTLAGAIATVASRRGMRTLLMETDPRTPVAGSYNLPASFIPAQAAPHLWLMLLDRQASVEEYLGFVVPRAILRAVFASTLYQYFIHAAPGLRELMMMGKIYHEIERRPRRQLPWDLVIVDLPASGQALEMIAMPEAARESFGENLVSREADQVSRFLRDPAKCAMVIVTTADSLAMTETLEIYRRLAAMRISTAAVALNRISAIGFKSTDVARFINRYGDGRLIPDAARLAAIARAELNRSRRESRSIGILQRQLAVPILRLSEGRAGERIPDRLAAELIKPGVEAKQSSKSH